MDRIEQLESRLAATDARLTALESRAEGCITQNEYRARLAALRAPETSTLATVVDALVTDQNAELAERDAALATARRERDEAVGVVRDWLGWRAGSKGPGFDAIVARARALVAGEAGPTGGIDWEKTAQSRQDVIAVKEREIATLRTSLAEAQGEVANERAKRIAAEHATGDTEEALLQVERDRDALRARLDEAGRLIERAISVLAVLFPGSVMLADLRAWRQP